jgi:hypothetical protein
MFSSTAAHQVARIVPPSADADRALNLPIKFRRAAEGEILSLLLQLSIEERVSRFGAASSNWAIRQWRSTFDRAHYLNVACEQGHELVGLVELFGASTTRWERPELAIVTRQANDRPGICRRLLQVGLLAARDLGAGDVVMCFDSIDAATGTLALQRGATVDHESRIAIVPCHALHADGLG